RRLARIAVRLLLLAARDRDAREPELGTRDDRAEADRAAELDRVAQAPLDRCGGSRRVAAHHPDLAAGERDARLAKAAAGAGRVEIGDLLGSLDLADREERADDLVDRQAEIAAREKTARERLELLGRGAAAAERHARDEPARHRRPDPRKALDLL